MLSQKNWERKSIPDRTSNFYITGADIERPLLDWQRKYRSCAKKG